MKKRIRFLVDDPPGIEEDYETRIMHECDDNYYYKDVWNRYCFVKKKLEGETFIIVIPPIREKKITVMSSVKKLYSVRKHQDVVDKFAHEAYIEKFQKDEDFLGGIYHGYKGFDIIDDHTIRVKYVIGAIHGNFDYNESFIIDLK